MESRVPKKRTFSLCADYGEFRLIYECKYQCEKCLDDCALRIYWHKSVVEFRKISRQLGTEFKGYNLP
jgi:hypothetical protein